MMEDKNRPDADMAGHEADDMAADYDLLAEIYDLFQEDYQPAIWADYIVTLNQAYCRRGNQGDGQSGRFLMLDLGCGTGRFCIEMTARGYETIGIDKSSAMLDRAMHNWQMVSGQTRFKDQPAPLFICQDITRFDLFGTVDLIVSLLDTINHIISASDLAKFFQLCANYLNSGGLLVFDAVSEYHLQEVLADQVFFQDQPDHTLLWQNQYDEKNKTSLSDLILFAADTCMADHNQQDVLYRRHDFQIKEQYYSRQDINLMIKDLPLELVACYHPFSRREPEEKAQRSFYVLRRS